jgi:hypothetical protein
MTKKKELIEEVKKTIDEQLKEKKNREVVIRNMNNEFDTKLKKSLNNFMKGQEEIEKIKKIKISKYKNELDKQLYEKKTILSRPLMDETERQLNKVYLF